MSLALTNVPRASINYGRRQSPVIPYSVTQPVSQKIVQFPSFKGSWISCKAVAKDIQFGDEQRMAGVLRAPSRIHLRAYRSLSIRKHLTRELSQVVKGAEDKTGVRFRAECGLQVLDMVDQRRRPIDRMRGFKRR